jgi:hypothetical protein
MRRNSFIFDGIFLPPAQLVQQGLDSLAEFRMARDKLVSVREGSMLPGGSVEKTFSWNGQSKLGRGPRLSV